MNFSFQQQQNPNITCNSNKSQYKSTILHKPNHQHHQQHQMYCYNNNKENIPININIPFNKDNQPKQPNKEEEHIKVTRIFTSKTSAFNLSKHKPSVIPTEYLTLIWFNYLKDSIQSQYSYTFPLLITSKMRSILIDWLQSLHEQLNMKEQTLFLCINILDRYLQISPYLIKEQLQLCGVAAFYIASKYEEIYFPEAKLLEKVTGQAFTAKDIIDYEKKILTALDYRLTVPMPNECFSMISVKFNMSRLEYFFGLMIMELFMLDENYGKYDCVVISIAIAYLTMRNYRKNEVRMIMVEDVIRLCMLSNEEGEDEGYMINKEKVMKCIADIIALAKDIGNMPYRSILIKFLKDKYMKISELYLQK